MQIYNSSLHQEKLASFKPVAELEKKILNT